MNKEEKLENQKEMVIKMYENNISLELISKTSGSSE